MAEGENKHKTPAEKEEAIKNINPVPPSKDLGRETPTPTQQAIEDEVARIEKNAESDELPTELSKNRTHMSVHRTRLSEHRTDLSEHRTGLSEHRTDLSEHRTDLSEHRTDLSDKRTEMSYQRTALSYERTLMSWIRTSTSMITFGFTIYKFFEELSSKANTPGKIFTPRVVGMLMILFGFLGLLFAQIQHHIAVKKLKQEYPEMQRSLSSVLAMLILVFGLMMFFAALFRQ